MLEYRFSIWMIFHSKFLGWHWFNQVLKIPGPRATKQDVFHSSLWKSPVPMKIKSFGHFFFFFLISGNAEWVQKPDKICNAFTIKVTCITSLRSTENLSYRKRTKTHQMHYTPSLFRNSLQNSYNKGSNEKTLRKVMVELHEETVKEQRKFECMRVLKKFRMHEFQG